VLAAGLMNSRFLAMGIALAPSLPGGPLKRAAQGQPVVDASWAMAMEDDGTFDRWFLFGSSAPQYLTWFTGTVVGALAGGVNSAALGLDAVFPTFFLALLIAELKDPTSRVVAVVGGVIALALTPVAPAGLPVLVASGAALIGLRRHLREEASA
jgi:predicted branched-subunit amino acid permease